jgi:hypothetical protein
MRDAAERAVTLKCAGRTADGNGGFGCTVREAKAFVRGRAALVGIAFRRGGNSVPRRDASNPPLISTPVNAK